MVNLLVIDCHDLGRHLGCYDRKTVNSPTLDQLAHQGVRFANSFCTAPQCSPSRAALYTGRYAHANGMFGLAHEPFNWRLHANEIYLPHYLQNAGYETALIGGQHVTGGDDGAIHQLGFDHVHTLRDARQIAAAAVEFLSRPHDKPFYLNLGFFEPHRDETGGFKSTPPDSSFGVEVPAYLPDSPEARGEFVELQGAVAWMDAAVGVVLSALRSQDLLKDTWVIFTTDHGIAMPRAKCTLYDPGIETALLMYAEPFGLTGGRVIRNMVSHVDFVPTVLDALGIRAETAFQGRSYWALLQDKPYIPREHVFAEKTFHTAYEPQRAVRTNSFKLIANLEAGIVNVPADIQHSPIYPQMIDVLTQERPPLELYDLRSDPLETKNLAADPAYAGVTRELTSVLRTWMHSTGDPILERPLASPYYRRTIELLRGSRT